MRCFLNVLTGLVLAIAGAIAPAAQPSRQPSASPEVVTRAMTVLRQHCVSCHNPEKKKGELVLTSRDAALKGGEEGPVLVPGDAAGSRIAAAVLPDADPHMPPKGQLTPDEITALKTWIDAGAPWDQKKLAETKPPATRPVTLGPLPSSYQPVMAMALSPDQKRLAAGRGDRLLVFDVSKESRPLLKEIAPPTPGDVIQSLTWSPDGKWLAAGGYRRIRIWIAESGDLHRELHGPEGRVTALAFTPDGQTLITADGEVASPANLRLWRMPAGEPVAAWKAHDDTIFSIKVTPDGATLLTAGADRVAKQWDLASRKELAKFEGHAAAVTAVAQSPDATLLATAGADKEIKIWDYKTRVLKASLLTNPAAVTDLVWADPKTVLSTSEDGVARFSSDEDKNRARKLFTGAPDVLYCAAVTSDGKTVYAGCHDGFVYVWSAAGSKLESKLPATQPATPKH